ncbi:hypothetical protein [Inquilinus limosus]|uniref:hypothetical protein n=1 Tax=Inquilinus limosus TaxID=171674 RepID=UPI003F5CE555
MSSTAWATLALLAATDGPVEVSPLRATTWLVGRQEPNGGWPDDGANSVLVGRAMLDHRLYNSVSQLWAPSEFERHHGASDG